MYYKLLLVGVESFIDYSKIIGNNFLLCQGPGGNTSLKEEGYIYIKKSGKFLSNSNIDTFKKINYFEIENYYTHNKDKAVKFDNELSIEAPLHVFLKSKYVFHYHSISSIIISAINESTNLDNLLINNKIIPIKYIRPGIDLAREISLEKQKHNLDAYFLYNHGIVVEGNNKSKIMKRVRDIESFFNKFIDYKKLIKLNKTIQIFPNFKDKVKNPFPEINFDLYKGKYLFPDHSVFFPDFLTSKNTQKNNTAIHYDNDYIYLNKKLTNVESIYFKTLLLIYGLIGDKEIVNYINTNDGENLRKSDDELIRRRVNR